MLKYSVVVPVYRGENSLKQLTAKLISSFAQLREDFELIFVYDRGPGNSWEIISQLKKEHPAIIKAIKLSRNFGQHNATICGFKYAKGTFIITMDEDLQHRPEDIELLIAEQTKSNADLVYGKYEELKHSPFRNITSGLLKKMLEVSIPDLHPDYTAFRLIRTKIAQATLAMNNPYTFLDGYLSWLTTQVSSVVVKHEERTEGTSSYTVSKLINHAINIFVTFSLLPIRIITFAGLLIIGSTTVGFLYTLLVNLLFDKDVTSTQTILMFLALGIGLILLALGIIGEYLHRVNLKTTQKPNFVELEIS